jgi:polyphosphate:AMP phosphotransferase
VSEKDWENWKQYDRFIATAEHVIKRTSTGAAPWRIVEGQDHGYRSLTVATILRDSVRKQLERLERRAGIPAATEPDERTSTPETEVGPLTACLAKVRESTVLGQLDMARTVSKEQYAEGLPAAQARLNAAYREAKSRGISTVIVFEGWDAAGKGGAIRRLTAALDARDYLVIPIAAPTDEETAHNYLWRFWRQIGRAGRFTIFDRSWYGRVLVERVEGFATEAEWMRAYTEINDFEQQLIEHGIVLVKFWLHITSEEQLRRFEERQNVPYKQWKLTEEDWRNRDRWDPYEQAVHKMVEQTSTSVAPWTLVEANDKHYARLKVIETVIEHLERRLDGKKPRRRSGSKG